MVAPIAPVTLANPRTSVATPAIFSAGGQQPDGSAFQSMFEGAVNTVERSSTDADNKLQDFLNGNTEDVHTTVLAAQRADLTFEMFMQVRNKVVSAYQEIMKMQV